MFFRLGLFLRVSRELRFFLPAKFNNLSYKSSPITFGSSNKSFNDNLVFEYTSQLAPGHNYGYIYNTNYFSGYENSANMGSCAGGQYGNERYVSTNNLTGSSIGITNTVGTLSLIHI